jgi:F0F1-type ATP synthase assembly protein I
MIAQGLATLIRFLIGIFLLQGVTALLVYTALGSDWQATWPLYLVLAVSIGTLVGLWFSAIVGADRRHAVARVSERLSKEREEIRVKAEQQRIKDARNQERLVAKASAASKAGGIGRGLTLKSGVVVGGAVGVGVAMLLTQFVTLGLLTLTTAGGAALGYSARVRQEKLIAGRRIESDRREVSVIPAKETPLTIGGRASRSRAAEQG